MRSGLKMHRQAMAILAEKTDLAVAGGYFLRREISAPSCWTMREAAHLLPGVGRDALAVDIGFGTGVWICELAARGFRNIVGIDKGAHVGPGEAHRALELAGASFTPICADFADARISGVALMTFFDGVSHCSHLPLACLPIWERMLAPGGLLVFDCYTSPPRVGSVKTTAAPRDVTRAAVNIGLREVLLMTRRYQGREIAMYAFSKGRGDV